MDEKQTSPVTIAMCYDRMHGDYSDVLRRLGNDDRIKRILSLFLRDGSFKELQAALQEKNYKQAFAAVHTLKGVSLNLGFTPLSKSACALTEALRTEEPTGDLNALYAQVETDYTAALDAVHWLFSAQGQS